MTDDNSQNQMVVREEFNRTETLAVVETAVNAVAAQARAATEARYVMALRRPRDWDTVRESLLKACRRPGFARTARYRKPIGKGVEGPSIRFAEEAMRCMGNILPTVMVTYDDDTKRVVRVSVTDLEANLTYEKDVVITKTVERSQVKDGQTVISSRQNSQGRTTYLVAATEDDLLNKENALVSKALRTAGLRLLPGDILEECMTEVLRTVADRDARDPDAARKQIADAFSALNVTPTMLREYLGHELGTCSPSELAELRAIWTAIRDGDATWSDTMEERRATAAVVAASETGTRGTAGLRQRLVKQDAPARQPEEEG